MVEELATGSFQRGAAALDLILQNQGWFTRARDGSRYGMVLIRTPQADDLADAANWLQVAQAQQQTETGAPAKPPSGAREERHATQPDSTGYSM